MNNKQGYIKEDVIPNLSIFKGKQHPYIKHDAIPEVTLMDLMVATHKWPRKKRIGWGLFDRLRSPTSGYRFVRLNIICPVNKKAKLYFNCTVQFPISDLVAFVDDLKAAYKKEGKPLPAVKRKKLAPVGENNT